MKSDTRNVLGNPITLLCAMSILAGYVASAECSETPSSATLPPGGTLVVVGDSITVNAVSFSYGFHHQLTNVFAKVCPDKSLKVASLGFCGYQVGTWLGVERQTRGGKPYMTHARPGWNVTEVLSNKVDVIAIFLGMNDILQPSVRDDDAALDKWKEDMRSLVKSLRDRTHAKGMILCTITPLTADRESPKNLVRERMSSRLRKLAAEENCAVAEFGDAVMGVIDDCRRDSSSFQPVPDFVHPRELGHIAMARELCHALGEGKCAELLSAHYAERLTVQHSREKANIAWRLRPLTKTLSSEMCRYRIDWFWHDTPEKSAPADGVEIKASLPTGWTMAEMQAKGRAGHFVVCGKPEMLVNEVELSAEFPGGGAVEIVPISTPWLVSRPWDFDDVWQGQNWKTNAVLPRVALDALAGPWSLVTPTYDYTGFIASGSLDPWQVFFGGGIDSFWAVRRVVSWKDRKVRAVFSHQTFSATLGFAAFVNGYQVFADSLNRSGKKRVETMFDLKKGVNELRIRVDHADWQRQFSVDLLPCDGDDLADLRYTLTPPETR